MRNYLHFFFIILIMIILSMGIVCASENTTDALNVDECLQEVLTDEISDSPVEENVDEVLTDDDNGRAITIYSEVYPRFGDSQIFELFDEDVITGNVTVVIDDKYISTKSFEGMNSRISYEFYIKDLNKIPGYGLHKVNVTYHKSEDKIYNKVANVEFTFPISTSLDIDEFTDYEPIYFNKDFKFSVFLPDDAKGIVYLYFNGKKYSQTKPDKKGCCDFKVLKKDLKLGYNDILCKFVSSSKNYPNKTIKLQCFVEQPILFNDVVAVGEKVTIDILSIKGTKVTVTLMKDEKILDTYSFDGAKFIIPIEKYVVKGENYISLKIQMLNHTHWSGVDFNAYTNSKLFKSSMSSSGRAVTVKLTGPKLNNKVQIYLDHNLVKSISMKKGKIKYTLSNLGLGKHHIKVLCNNKKKFFSKTFHINVQYYLTLKSVKVKKSAKKLVLSATVKTLKQNKKGLKVTFKFNGKKYIGKTNKNGVAKITVKKQALKKLKVGKKVKYLAKYGKMTVKKTAKVKK